jgi:hypothetical protein
MRCVIGGSEWSGQPIRSDGLGPDQCRTIEHDGAVLVRDRRPKLRQRFVLPRRENLDLGRDLVAWPHRRLEVPIDVEKDASRRRQIFGDQGVQ